MKENHEKDQGKELLESFTDEQIAEIVKSNDDLDRAEENLLREEIEEKK